MKGVVFTELYDMIEKKFGANMLDDVIDDCELESGGAYTTIGTYDYRELIKIVNALSQHTGIPVKDLIQTYGYHLFSRFHEMMPVFFEKPKNSFEFLETVHDTIHVEVRKIYPDAQLPEFLTEREGERTLRMTYQSRCPFADFAEGLIHGCVDFYKDKVEIKSKDQNTDAFYSRVFTLMKK